MDLNLYLKRIHYSGPITPTLETLTGLQKSHALNVPFENLDIHYKIPIDLLNSYYKIVIRNRGGFCYELNGLFFRLLKRIGFLVKMVSARVYNPEKGYGPEFDHMALLVTLQRDTYLVDVGFGEFAIHPVKIELGKEVADPKGQFRIDAFESNYLVALKKNPEGVFIPEYIFSEKARLLPEFFERCVYHQTSSESHFTQKRICTLPTRKGRITLTGNMLKILESGKVTERELADETEVKKVLRDYFKIQGFSFSS